MKELRNGYDSEVTFTDLYEAKTYYMPDTEGFPECKDYTREIEEANSLEELADVLNKYTDLFGDGSGFKVVEF